LLFVVFLLLIRTVVGAPLQGADPDAADLSNGWRPLHAAARAGGAAATAMLLAAGADRAGRTGARR
jgi:ankyrin repeat protein